MKFKMILAADVNGGIGKDATLPWRLSSDLKHFRKLTTGNRKNAVFMGRTTWESIPSKFRPLPNRVNFVLSRTMPKDDDNDQFKVVRSMDQLVEKLESEEFDSVWCIGGATLYAALLESRQIDAVYLTRVLGDFECDVKLSGLYATLKRDFTLQEDDKENNFGTVQCENGVEFVFEHYA